MLKKRFTTVILALAVAVVIPCTAFAGELDAEAATVAPAISIGENASDIENTAADNNDVQDLTTAAPADSENQQTIAEPTTEEQQAVAAPESTVEQEVITDEPATEEAIAVDILEEPVPLEEVPAIVEELPAIVEELPIESTLVIHHLFQYGDIVCDDYETITDITAGDSICIGEYNYEDDYIFVDCLNEDEMFTLAEGENEVILNYTLKDGFRMVE